ncbi:MAG: HEAT repeat domain-containing protein [Deltaproteobacteria bacterium]|nr:HEAT repeat domain-containing protein [Deltaproteobacteria bacterium]
MVQRILVMLFALLVAFPGIGQSHDKEESDNKKQETSPEIRTLFAQLADPDSGVRQKAAEALVDHKGADIVRVLRKRAKTEKDFHANLAIHFALASHGDREALKVLIASLKQTGHYGFIYLRRVTGRDFGWDAKAYHKWLAKTSEKDIKKIQDRKAITEKWSNFSSAFTKCYFSERMKDKKVSPETRKMATESPEAKAWGWFSTALKQLQEGADRSEVAKAFRKLVSTYPDSYYAEDSRELTGLLMKMVDEDKAWNEPADHEHMSVQEKIKYNIYRLRDVACRQFSQPGMCNVLSSFGAETGEYNAAIELSKIGRPAIPALIALLGDRRPIRSVGYWGYFKPTRTVLRYQDAAMQILNKLLPSAFYGRSSTATYFSTEEPEIRGKVIARIRNWQQESVGKSETDLKWLAVKQDPGIYPLLELLRALAFEHGQKERVLKELRRQYETRHRFQRPQLSSLMCELGDTSKVAEVGKAYLAGAYNYAIRLPDDSASGSNAQEHSLRQMILYGSHQLQEKLKRLLFLEHDPLSKGSSLHRKLTELALDEWGGLPRLPKTYDRKRFPIHLLVALLDYKGGGGNRSQGNKRWTWRGCDKAAEAIQAFTGVGFGYKERDTLEMRDSAIKKIREWWKKQQENDGQD